jgi:hypothetical protein
MRSPVLFLSTAATAMIFGACGGSPESVSERDLEEQVKSRLTEYAGQEPDRIDCPAEGLKAEVGATQRCVLYAGPDKLGLTATVTSVEGDDVSYNVKVDERMMK